MYTGILIVSIIMVYMQSFVDKKYNYIHYYTIILRVIIIYSTVVFLFVAIYTIINILI